VVQKGLAVHAEIALLVTHVVLLLNDTNITINTAESSYEHTMVPVTDYDYPLWYLKTLLGREVAYIARGHMIESHRVHCIILR
jgi:hypothetical protein